MALCFIFAWFHVPPLYHFFSPNCLCASVWFTYYASSTIFARSFSCRSDLLHIFFCGRALLGFHSLSHTLPVQLSGHSTGAAVIPFFSLVSQVGVGSYYYYYLLTLVLVIVICDLATGILCGQQSTGCYIYVHSFGVVWTLIYWFYFCVFLFISWSNVEDCDSSCVFKS